MRKALIFTGLVKLDENLVGTAVVYLKIADLLRRLGYAVDLVVPQEASGPGERINYHPWNKHNNHKLIKAADLVVFGAYPPIEPLLYAYRQKKIIATYLWSIAPIGALEFKDFAGVSRQKELHQYISASYNLSLLLSDKIFCRNEKVRVLVLGSLASLGRIDPGSYGPDKTLRRLVDTAPFGLEASAPKHRKDIYRGVVKGVNKDDFLLIWNGGVWNWNDGETLVKAMKLIRDKHQKKNIKLVLQGFKHPDEGQKLSKEAEKTLELIKRSGLENKNIFITPWLPFKERDNYLSECDAGIVTSPNIPEANLFLKTRVYDYLWAGLPVILGDNEAFAPFIRKMGLGLVAGCGQADSFARAAIELAEKKYLRDEIAGNIIKVKKQLSWKKTLKTAEDYFKRPYADDYKYAAKRGLYRGSLANNINIIKGRA